MKEMKASTKATVYLNPLEHQGHPYIRIWHKPNPFIVKRLKEAAWIKYSKTYKCYVMHHTPQAIELTFGHFQGLALVNTRYLHRPKRLKPSGSTPVLSGNLLSDPLPRPDSMPVLRLQPLQLKDGNSVIGITFKYNEMLYKLLKNSKSTTWDKEVKCFTMGTGANSIHALLCEVEGVAWLWLSQELRVKDIPLLRQLWEQSYGKCYTYISCPLPYLEKLFLLNYSMNTIRTYHSLLVRFLNAHSQQGLETISMFREENINAYHRTMVQAGTYSCSFVNQSITRLSSSISAFWAGMR